jgi:hypothetical protein
VLILKNSVFQKLKLLHSNIQHAACLWHILHNCAKQAGDKIQTDIESLVKTFLILQNTLKS